MGFDLRARLAERRAQHRYRTPPLMHSSCGRTAVVDGRTAWDPARFARLPRRDLSALRVAFTEDYGFAPTEGIVRDHFRRILMNWKRELMEDETARYTVKMVVIGYGNNAVIPVTDGIVPPDEFTPPELVAEGNTPMGQAYQTALKFIELWKQDCSKRKVDYFRPWLVNTTDGQPTDSWQDAAKALTKAEDNKQVVSWVVATEGANIPILKQISARRPVLYLRNLDYQSLFLWLSSSLAVVSNSDTDGRKPIDPVDSFADIY